MNEKTPTPSVIFTRRGLDDIDRKAKGTPPREVSVEFVMIPRSPSRKAGEDRATVSAAPKAHVMGEGARGAYQRSSHRFGEKEFIMASNKNLVPEAKKALEQFKMEAANEVGVTLQQSGYNGELTSRQAGSIGGQMVNNMNPVRTMRFERHNRISQGHKITVKYAFSLTV